MILYKYIFYNFTKNKKHKIKFTKIKTQIIFTKNLHKIKNTKIKLLKIYFTNLQK